jgi:hypothetical protein
MSVFANAALGLVSAQQGRFTNLGLDMQYFVQGWGQQFADLGSALRLDPGAGIVTVANVPSPWPWSIPGAHVGGLIQQATNGQNMSATLDPRAMSRMLSQPNKVAAGAPGTNTGTSIIIDTQGPDPLIQEVD